MSPKNEHAAALGRKGGATMSPARQAHLARIAQLGALSRWAPRDRKGQTLHREEAALAAALTQAREALDRALELREAASPAWRVRIAEARTLLDASRRGL